MNQFPQPTRPVESLYALTPIPSQNTACMGTSNDIHSMHNEFGSFKFDFPMQEQEQEQEAMKELVTRVVYEWYEKLPDNIRSQINLERFIASSSNNYMSAAAAADHDQYSTTIRGHKQQLQQEIKHKLERFKIRTTVDANTTTSRGLNNGGDQHQKLERFKIRTVQLGEVAEGQEEAKQ